MSRPYDLALWSVTIAFLHGDTYALLVRLRWVGGDSDSSSLDCQLVPSFRINPESRLLCHLKPGRAGSCLIFTDGGYDFDFLFCVRRIFMSC